MSQGLWRSKRVCMMKFVEKLYNFVQKHFYLCLLFPVVVGSAFLAYSTTWGPGVGGDATIYITCARNLLAGKGLALIGPQGEFRLLPYFPPFLSLTLAALSAPGLDMVQVARWLNVFAFGGLIWISGQVLYRKMRSGLLGLAIAFLLAFSPVLIPIYAWAMAEPLAIFLGFLSVVLLLEYVDVPQKRWAFYGSALAAGLSFLTRYNSVVFVGLGMLGVFLYTQKTRVSKILKAALYFIVGFVPMAVWLVYDVSMTTTVGSRRVETAAGMVSRLGDIWPAFRTAFLFWLIPDSWVYSPVFPGVINQLLPLATVVLIIVWLAVVGWVYARKIASKSAAEAAGDKNKIRILFLITVFILAFLGVIIFIHVTTFPPITLNNRMISPVHVAVLWLLVLLSGFTLQLVSTKKWARGFIVLVMGLLIVAYGWRSVRVVYQLHRDGQGYTAPVWQNSQTIQVLKDIPPDMFIVSNEANAVLFITGRPAYQFAEIYFDKPLEEFTSYGEEAGSTDTGQLLFREGKAALVLFDSIDDQLAGLYGDRSGERISTLVKGLYRAYRVEDGGIFYYQQP